MLKTFCADQGSASFSLRLGGMTGPCRESWCSQLLGDPRCRGCDSGAQKSLRTEVQAETPGPWMGPRFVGRKWPCPDGAPGAVATEPGTAPETHRPAAEARPETPAPKTGQGSFGGDLG